jgi:hypothetical protein
VNDDAAARRQLHEAVDSLAALSRPPAASAVLSAAHARQDRLRAGVVAAILVVVVPALVVAGGGSDPLPGSPERLAASPGPDAPGPVTPDDLRSRVEQALGLTLDAVTVQRDAVRPEEFGLVGTYRGRKVSVALGAGSDVPSCHPKFGYAPGVPCRLETLRDGSVVLTAQYTTAGDLDNVARLVRPDGSYISAVSSGVGVGVPVGTQPPLSSDRLRRVVLALAPEGPPAATAAPVVNPSPYPYTDCDALRPGDALNFPDLNCDPDNVTQVYPVDCIDGIYVHLVRPEGGDLEGIAGRTPTWREAAPREAHGRTPWAFNNCLEHG